MGLILEVSILASLAYTLFMADPVWGMLPKSQSEATTIDQEIDAKIAAHNADPTAHLGTGQSIDVHRTNSMIDHPAGSIPADKASATLFDYTFDFRALTGLTVHGDVQNAFWPGVEINASTGSPGYGSVQSLGGNGRGWLDYTNDWLVQFTFWQSDDGGPTGLIGIGQLDTGAIVRGVYLTMGPSSDVLTWKKGTDTVNSSNLAISKYEWHTMRLQYSSADRKLYIYLDGVLVATLNDPNTNTYHDGLNNFILKEVDGGMDDGLLMLETLRVSVWVP